ncbi:nuclease [filamentous cyanobacterium CCP1]|nr:nuclease [filamentous cyanobacterium CCP2]PSB56375.1 nuclease [filamentous cyanobacterium CCP1]
MPYCCWKNQTVCRNLMLCSVVCGLLLLLGCQSSLPQTRQQVRVVKVVSGQTLEVLDMSGSNPITERVRLLGIEAPTGDQEPWSTQATDRLESLIGTNRTVWLEADVQAVRETSNGSKLRLAYVWRDNQLLNESLVAEGYVLGRSSSPNTKYEKRLTYAQEKARLTGRGIWNPSYPMAQSPEEFRRLK